MTDVKALIASAASELQEAAASIDSEQAANAALMDAASRSLEAAKQERDTLRAENSTLTAQIADLQAKIKALTPDPWAVVDRTGATDVTEAFRKLTLAGGKVPAGIYTIDPTKTIKVPAGKTLDISAAKLKAKPNGEQGSCVIELAGDDSHLIGGEIIGDRGLHDYSAPGTHEWGFGVRISGNGCSIDGTKVMDCTGDGVNVDSAQNFTIKNVVSQNNRRNAIAITDASTGLVTDSQFLDTNGTKPQAGIDLEPNTGRYVKGVTFQRCVVRGNAWGVNIQNSRVVGVKFIDNDIAGNRTRGMLNLGGLDVTVEGGKVRDNGDVGLAYADKTTGKVAGVTFSGNKGKALVINPGAKVDVSVKSTFL
jgi:hypothetical protein